MTTHTVEKQENHSPRWWQQLLKGDYFTRRPRRGDTLEATILSVSERDLLVELEGKRDGIVPRQDLEQVDEAYLAQLEVGDVIPVRIVKAPFNKSGIVVSLKQGLQNQDWLRAKHLLAEEEVTEVEVTGTNRGGVLVSFGRLQGFVPNSHLSSVPRWLKRKERREKKANLVGATLAVVVIEVNPRRKRLVMSERLAQNKHREALFEELHEGAIRKGVIVNLTDFGAFVNLGGADGLLHISEISWDHVSHPQDVLNVGDEIEVYVLSVDRERERIALSRKRLLSSTQEKES